MMDISTIGPKELINAELFLTIVYMPVISEQKTHTMP